MTDWTGSGTMTTTAALEEVRKLVGRNLLGLTQHLALYGDEEAQNAAIDAAVLFADATVELELNTKLGTKKIMSWPEDDKVEGVDYDILEEPYDFHRTDYIQWGYLKLRVHPVQSVQRLRLKLGEETTLITYPIQWIRIDKKSGNLSIVPTPGAGWGGMLLQSGQFFIPYLSMGWISDNIPQIIAIDYTAGLGGVSDYGSETFKPEYMNLAEQRARLAAKKILLDLSDSVEHGVSSQSISEDGITQSISYARNGAMTLFGAKIQKIEQDWEEFKVYWHGRNTGIQFTVV